MILRSIRVNGLDAITLSYGASDRSIGGAILSTWEGDTWRTYAFSALAFSPAWSWGHQPPYPLQPQLSSAQTIPACAADRRSAPATRPGRLRPTLAAGAGGGAGYADVCGNDCA